MPIPNVFRFIPPWTDLPVLLAQDPHRRERAVSRVSEGVPGKSGRLHAPVAGADRSIQGGEATTGPAAEGENLRKPETFSQRAGGAEEPGIRRRTAAEIGRSRSK